MRDEMAKLVNKYGLQPVLHELIFAAAQRITPTEFGHRTLNRASNDLSEAFYYLDRGKENR